jgi:hypothetical protein
MSKLTIIEDFYHIKRSPKEALPQTSRREKGGKVDRGERRDIV